VAIQDLQYADLDDSAVGAAVGHRELQFASARLLGSRPIDTLTDLQLLVREGDGHTRAPTIAAVVLFALPSVLKRILPNAETVLSLESSINTPLTGSEWRNLISSLEAHSVWIIRQLVKDQIDIPSDVVRELLLNAYIHRCYRTQAPVQIHVRSDELEIQNPGGLLGSLATDSLIHSPPIYRNFLLADSARQFGYCEKAGSGIDKIYYNLILNGFDFPIFQSKNDSFSALIRLRRDKPFADFVHTSGGDLQLRLTDLIVLRALRARRNLAVDELVRISQRPLDYLRDVLYDLERRMLIRHVADVSYCLSDRTLDTLAQLGHKAQLSLFKERTA
jgi:hypothetical protein